MIGGFGMGRKKEREKEEEGWIHKHLFILSYASIPS